MCYPKRRLVPVHHELSKAVFFSQLARHFKLATSNPCLETLLPPSDVHNRNSLPGQLNAPYAVGGLMAGVSLGGDTRPSNPGVRERARPASAGVKHIWDQTPQVLPKAPPHALTNGEWPHVAQSAPVNWIRLCQVVEALVIM